MMGYLALLRGAVGNNIMKSVTALALLIYLFNLYTPCEEISVEAKCKQKLFPSPGPGRVTVRNHICFFHFGVGGARYILIQQSA